MIDSSSPLLEADPHSLDEFFNRLKSNQIQGMPREINLKISIDQRVTELRQQRLKFTEDYKNLKPERKRKQVANVDDFKF